MNGPTARAITKEEIESLIREALSASSLNHFGSMGRPGEKMWEEVLIGFADGGDPYFLQFKKDIGDFYWTPSQVFSLKFGDDLPDSALTVVSLGFPQTARTRADQRAAEGMPCHRWQRTRGEWETVIDEISSGITDRLAAKGIRAVSIDERKEFSRHTSPRFGIASNWSHRHTAFVAGLGTFGLSDGLITERGKAMRFASLVLEGRWEPTPRPYKTYQEYCSFYRDGSCGACIARCPVQAIQKETGHDKEACFRFLQKVKTEIGPDYVRNSHYFSSCGLCQSRVPCQDRIPR